MVRQRFNKLPRQPEGGCPNAIAQHLQTFPAAPATPTRAHNAHNPHVHDATEGGDENLMVRLRLHRQKGAGAHLAGLAVAGLARGLAVSSSSMATTAAAARTMPSLNAVHAVDLHLRFAADGGGAADVPACGCTVLATKGLASITRSADSEGMARFTFQDGGNGGRVEFAVVRRAHHHVASEAKLVDPGVFRPDSCARSRTDARPAPPILRLRPSVFRRAGAATRTAAWWSTSRPMRHGFRHSRCAACVV